MKKVLVIFGTRPEAIKLYPITKALRKEEIINTKICITAQHRSMLDDVLKIFDISPDYDLDIMQESQDLFSISTNILIKLKPILKDFNPDLILVHGDTTTTFISALAGFYFKIKIAHIEAGLRTFDKYNPFPEEINRELTTKLATYHFAPTKLAYKNLIKDGVKKQNIRIVGNSVIDALKITLNKIKQDKKYKENIISSMGLGELLDSKFILVTAHRRESFGVEIENIANALKEIALKLPNISIIYPLHLNPNIQIPMRKILGNIDNIHLIEPLSYEKFLYLMYKSYMILTDSGGIQEEATYLHKPTLILRNKTERKEALSCKTLRLIGTNKENIIQSVLSLFNKPKIYKKMANPKNPLVFGDGNSAKKIVNFIKKL